MTNYSLWCTLNIESNFCCIQEAQVTPHARWSLIQHALLFLFNVNVPVFNFTSLLQVTPLSSTKKLENILWFHEMTYACVWCSTSMFLCPLVTDLWMWHNWVQLILEADQSPGDAQQLCTASNTPVFTPVFHLAFTPVVHLAFTLELWSPLVPSAPHTIQSTHPVSPLPFSCNLNELDLHPTGLPSSSCPDLLFQSVSQHLVSNLAEYFWVQCYVGKVWGSGALPS